ncbi:MAG: aspartate--tRNA ligase [Ureaplasma sp.]|nr:aspartate--tRNA ligase [Ureaplasma sp.]
MKRLYCNEVTSELLNKQVKVFGWIKKVKKLGKLIFLVISDRTGTLQIVLDETNKYFDLAKTLKRESVVMIEGTIHKKVSENNSDDEIEIFVDNLDVLSVSETPPLIVETETDALEEIRMSNRFLDLRRPNMQHNIIFRSKVIHSIRNFLFKNNFIEIETPILGKPTPEGARDYLVPSRIHPNSFYALPQSPQIYKQLLMVSGFDRYYQIARCFRDEDLRSDRQPEFTQLDMELSFTNEKEIQDLIENLLKTIFKENLDIDVSIPFRRINYIDAMNNYGSDKPDLRFDLKLKDCTDFFKNSNFELFRDVQKNNFVLKSIVCDSILQKSDINLLEKFAIDNGAKSLIWVSYNKNDDSLTGSISKKIEKEFIINYLNENKLNSGTILFAIGDLETVNKSLGAVRINLADILGLKKENDFQFTWVVNWPLYEYNDDKKMYLPAHHPFTQPQDEFHSNFDVNQKDALAKAYDIVLNGYELGGGSIRITNPEMQERMFKILGMSQEEIENKFGYLLNAFKFGVPPHGGIAIGIDRMIAIMLNLNNIKDVIAFPKNANAFDQMLKAPSSVNIDDLNELHISLKK